MFPWFKYSLRFFDLYIWEKLFFCHSRSPCCIQCIRTVGKAGSRNEKLDRPNRRYDFPGSSGTCGDIYFKTGLSALWFFCFGRGQFGNFFTHCNSWNAWISAGFRNFSHLFLLIFFCEIYTNFRGVFKQCAEKDIGKN